MFPIATPSKSSPEHPLKERIRRSWFAILILFSIPLALSACNSGGAQADEEAAQFQIREPRATFTPTTLPANGTTDQGVANQNGASTVDGSSTETGSQSAAPASEDTANGSEADNVSSAETDGSSSTVNVDPNFAGRQATITSALVNGRGGPGTDYDVVGVVAESEIFDVLGQNDAGNWWHLCCYLGEEFWVINDFVTVDQSSADQSSAAAVQPAQPAPTNTPVPAAQPAAAPAESDSPAQPAAPAESDSPAQPAAPNDFAFDLVVQEQFGETSVVRIFLYVFSDSIQALEGYTLKVTKDGVELPIGTKSYGPQAGYTWPVSTTRQRFENMKLEFPDEAPAGNWTVQLADGSGNLVGPPATFELSGNDQNQELYVRYKEK